MNKEESKRHKKEKTKEKDKHTREAVKRVVLLTGNWTSACTAQDDRCNALHVQYAEYTIKIYKNTQMRTETRTKHRIMAATVTQNTVWILHKDGIHTYTYNNDRIQHRRVADMQGVVAGIAQKHCIVARVHTDKAVNVLYNTKDNTVRVIDTITDINITDTKRVCRMTVQDNTHAVIEYEDGHTQCIDIYKDAKHNASIQKHTHTDRSKAHTVMMDKRNILHIENSKVEHRVVRTHRTILSRQNISSITVHHSIDKLQIHTQSNGVVDVVDIVPYMDRFAVHDSTSIADSARIECGAIHTNPSVLHVCETQRYTHCMMRDGYVEVTDKSGKHTEHKSIVGPVITRGLTSFHAITNGNSTVLVLHYTDSYVAVEYRYTIDTKRTYEVPCTEQIQSIKRYRKDVIVQYETVCVRWYIDKEKNVRREDIDSKTACTDSTHTLVKAMLVSHNRNTQQKKACIVKTQDTYVVYVEHKEIVQHAYISFFYLLYSGYAYCTGLCIVFSFTDYVLHYPFAVIDMQVYNETHMSALLIHLACGQIHLVHIRDSRVYKHAELFQRLHPDYIDLLSLTSFIVFSGLRVTIFGSDDTVCDGISSTTHGIPMYILPVLQYTFVSSPRSYTYTLSHMYVCTDTSLYELQDSDIAPESFLSCDDSIRAFS